MGNGCSEIKTLTGPIALSCKDFYRSAWNEPFPSPRAGTELSWTGTGDSVLGHRLLSLVMKYEGLARLLKAAIVVSATWGHCVQGY